MVEGLPSRQLANVSSGVYEGILRYVCGGVAVTYQRQAEIIDPLSVSGIKGAKGGGVTFLASAVSFAIRSVSVMLIVRPFCDLKFFFHNLL